MPAPRGTLRVAAAPINWGVWRDAPNNPDPDELLDEVAAAGYVGCELGPLGYLASNVGDLERRFAARGLALASAFVAADLARPLSSDSRTEIRTVVELLAAGGCPVLIISDQMPPNRTAIVARVEAHPETWWNDDDWRQVSETLSAIAEIAGERGLALAYHPHVGTHVESSREIDRLIRATDPATVKLCLDTGHMLIGGADPVAVLNAAGDRVIHVHAKDVNGSFLARLQAGEISYVEGVRDGLYCDFGDGLVDWSGFAAGLSAHGFAGWVVAEQDRQLTPGDPAPVTSLRRNREFLRRLLNA